MVEARAMRVGVVSDSASLVIALSLQGHGIDVVRLSDPSRPESVDVAFIDVSSQDAALMWLDTLSPRMPCVMTGLDPDDLRAFHIERPYSMVELLTALSAAMTEAAGDTGLPDASDDVGPDEDAAGEATAFDGNGVGATANDGEAASPVAQPLFQTDRAADMGGDDPSSVVEDASLDEQALLEVPPGVEARPRRRRRRGPAPPLEAASSAVAEPSPRSVDASEPDPIALIGLRAAELQDLLSDAPFLVSVESLANGVARVLASELQAVTVALWSVRDDHLRLLGDSGLSEGERRLTPHIRHPMLEEARHHGGLVWENLEAGGPLTAGLPGARTPAFAVALVDTPDVPVEIVTVGAMHSLAGCLLVVEEILVEGADGWRTAQEVEALGRRLSQ